MSITATILKLNTQRAESVRSEWKIVTPQMAAKWLEGNTHNRPVRTAAVMKYAADMKAGRWRQTHQGIAFDYDGVLLDGQHRLFAVLEADTNVIMQVGYGFDPEGQAFMDSGIHRTVVDVARLSGEVMAAATGLHGAVAHRMRLGLLSKDANSAPETRQSAVAFLRSHYKAVDYAVAKFPPAKKVKGVSSAGPLAAVARAFYHEDHRKLDRFCEVLQSGLPADEREHVIIKLRNGLMGRSAYQGRTEQVEAYAKTQRILKAYFAGTTINRNLIPVTEEGYPLPTLKA